MKKIENEENEKKESFFEKMKDKKYKAKVEFIGYGIFIVVLIIYLNVASMGQSPSTSNTVLQNKENESTEQEEEEDIDLFKKINNNYTYDIHITLKKKQDEESDIIEEQTVRYFGKRFSSNTEIEKEIMEEKNIYYKIDKEYYQKKTEESLPLEQEKFEKIEENTIYDVLEKKYIELDEIKNLIEKSSLDHVTNYSSGKKESIYHLNLKDIILNYTEDEEVEIGIVIENSTLTIEIDYTNFMKEQDKNITECKAEFIYTNIDQVEAFEIISKEESSDSTNES